MADPQELQEELQQSVVLSDEDYLENYNGSPVQNVVPSTESDGGASFSMTDEENTDAEAEEGDTEYQEDRANLDAEQYGNENAAGRIGLKEGLEDDTGITLRMRTRSAELKTFDSEKADRDLDDDHHSEQEDDDEVDDDDEGVGAVKIKPGNTDDEIESDSGGTGSESGNESEGSAAWEEAGGNDEEDEDEDEDDDDAYQAEAMGICMFCKKTCDPNLVEGAAAVLTCTGCGDSAHLRCARDKNAFKSRSDTRALKCPECIDEDIEIETLLSEDDDPDMNTISREDGEEISHAAGRSSQLEANLLPAQKGAKPGSHSVFNQLVVEGDPMDGSRILRKRKTSSAEAEAEAVGMSLRKRGRKACTQASQTHAVEESRPQTLRSLRLKVMNNNHLVKIRRQSRSSLIVSMKVSSSSLGEILSQRPKKRASGTAQSTWPAGRRCARRERASEIRSISATSEFIQPFYGLIDREADELKGKPYGGILVDAEADTAKTLPILEDRRRFDEAKQKAEEEWRSRVQEMQAEACIPVKKSRKNTGPASQIECIQFGGWEIDTWYAAPYPEEYSRNRVLFICEFCLKYMNSDYVAWRHKLKCPAKYPPGDEIYRSGTISFFEVDGRKNPVYCQNLCLLAKLFLGSKTLYYDVEPFLFYILCEYDDHGYHFVGYFSKEKRASSQNNVSCILTLPIHQRKGYGNLLIDFSYLLTRVEKKTGSPEKPLSDMGLVSYRNYWRLVMCRYFLEYHHLEENQVKYGVSINQLSADTGMTADDVVSALEGMRFLVRDTQSGLYAYRVDLDFCHETVEKWRAKNYVTLDYRSLTWTPFVMGRGNTNTFELGPALNTIAPREEEEIKLADSRLAGDGRLVAKGTALKQRSPPGESLGQTLVVSTANDPSLEGSADPLMNWSISQMEGKERRNGTGVSENDRDDVDERGAEEQDTEEDEGMEVSGNEGGDEDVEGEQDEMSWLSRYENIPPSRFQVFPPITVRRENRSRTTVGKSTLSRSAKRRPSAGSRRSSGISKPRGKIMSSRRKVGGTGRGPGRWPKGTKKSDYGNADSGPGFPPGWLDKAGSTEADGPDEARLKEATPLGTSPKRRSSAASSTPSIEYGAGKAGPAGKNYGRFADEAPSVPFVASDLNTGEGDR